MRFILFAEFILVKMYLNSTNLHTKFQSEPPKCVLRVSTTHYEPFMYQSKSGDFYKGIDYNLIKTIVEKENLSLLLQNEVSHFKTELLVGGLFPNSEQSSDFITPRGYFEDDLTWCVQKEPNNILLITNIFFAATPIVWITVIFGIGYVR